jgi:hypothetical protein
MKEYLALVLLNQPWLTVFEGEGEGEGGDPAGGAPPLGGGAAPPAPAPTPAPTGGGGKTFTQDEVNGLLAKEKREQQVKTQKTLDELEAYKARTTLSEEERTKLDGTIQDLQNQLLTKDEQVRRQQEKAKKENDERYGKLEQDHKNLFATYREAETGRSITDAAVAGKAYRPSQIVAILNPVTQFVEIKGEDDEPTGKYKTVVNFPDKDKDGNDVTLQITAAEAVNRMKEMEDYFNLFEGEGTGGIGGTNRQKAKGKGDPAELAKTDPKAYIEQRRSGKLPAPK